MAPQWGRRETPVLARGAVGCQDSLSADRAGRGLKRDATLSEALRAAARSRRSSFRFRFQSRSDSRATFSWESGRVPRSRRPCLPSRFGKPGHPVETTSHNLRTPRRCRPLSARRRQPSLARHR